MLSFGFPRIAYPGAGTVYYYSFHLHYVTAKYNLLPPDNPDHEWIPGGTAYSDWLSYGHQAPGTVRRVFAVPVLLYQRVVFTWGPLLAVIFLLGLGGLLSLTARRRPAARGGAACARSGSCGRSAGEPSGCTGRRAAPPCCPG